MLSLKDELLIHGIDHMLANGAKRVKHTILIVDDEIHNQSLLKRTLRGDYYILTASNGLEGLEVLEEYVDHISLIISDHKMPVMEGTEFLEKANQISPSAIKILLTGYSDIVILTHAVNKCGLFQYILKPFEPEELIVRIRALLKRSQQIPKSLAVRDLLTYKEITLLPETYSVQINDKVQKLTPIEFDIFNLLFQNHGNMVSAQKLLKEVWGYEPDDSVETIRVHIRHLRSKIDKISGDKKYIETIYGGGYKLNV